MRAEDKSARTYRTPVFGKPGPALPAKGRVKGSRTNRKNCAAPSSRRRPGPSEQWRNLAVAREPKNTPPGARRYRITLPPDRPSPESEEGTRLPGARATAKPLQTFRKLPEWQCSALCRPPRADPRGMRACRGLAGLGQVSRLRQIADACSLMPLRSHHSLPWGKPHQMWASEPGGDRRLDPRGV